MGSPERLPFPVLGPFFLFLSRAAVSLKQSKHVALTFAEVDSPEHIVAQAKDVVQAEADLSLEVLSNAVAV